MYIILRINDFIHGVENMLLDHKNYIVVKINSIVIAVAGMSSCRRSQKELAASFSRRQRRK